MRASSLLQLFDALLETSVVARAQYLMSKTYRDRGGMRKRHTLSRKAVSIYTEMGKCETYT